MNIPIELVPGPHGRFAEERAMCQAALASVDHHDVLGEGAPIRAMEGHAQGASAQRDTAAAIQAGPAVAGLVTAWALAAGVAEPHRLTHFVCPQALLALLKRGEESICIVCKRIQPRKAVCIQSIQLENLESWNRLI